MRLSDALAAVRESLLCVVNDGTGGLVIRKCDPAAVVPRGVALALAEHRDTLAAPCRECGAYVAAPCRAGEVCPLIYCPYKDWPRRRPPEPKHRPE